MLHSGHNMARTPYENVLSPEAVEDLRALRAHLRALVQDAVQEHLRHAPTHESGSRIKRLRGLTRPQYRLRIDDIRVFYDVVGGMVQVLAIVPKAEADRWLERVGE